MRAEALEVLDYLGLGDYAGRRAVGLPFGTLKRIELARALVARPRLLLLDEPAGGLNHEEVDALGGLIRRFREDFDLTILLVEHHMSLVMSISDRVHVLNFGRMIASGTPAEVRAEPGRDRGVPRHGGGRDAIAEAHPESRWRRCSSCATSRPATARSRRCTASRSRSTRAQVVALLGANGAGQDDDAAGRLRAWSAGPARCSSPAATSARAGPTAVARLGIAHVPEGRGILGELTVCDNLRMGAYTVRDRRAFKSRLRARARAVPVARRAARPAGRHALGRRAADARARARAARTAAAAAARRALARARADRSWRSSSGSSRR